MIKRGFEAVRASKQTTVAIHTSKVKIQFPGQLGGWCGPNYCCWVEAGTPGWILAILSTWPTRCDEEWPCGWEHSFVYNSIMDELIRLLLFPSSVSIGTWPDFWTCVQLRHEIMKEEYMSETWMMRPWMILFNSSIILFHQSRHMPKHLDFW